ncbi:MAG: HlyD family secretion protein [Pirellulaceae bacterium]|jgi:HlyD family secretion protein
MKKSLIVLLVVAIICGAVYYPLSQWWWKRGKPAWRFADVTQGNVVSVVNSTGTIKPVMSVQIGAFVSGPIDPDVPLANFNQEVKKGDILAKIDQRIYEADVERDEAAIDAAIAGTDAAKANVKSAEAAVVAAEAALRTRLSEVERAKAQLKQAENDEGRAQLLATKNADFISNSEMDQFRFNRLQLAEQVNVALAAAEQSRAAILQAEAFVVESKASIARTAAAVTQAKANKMRSVLNRDYTIITSPVDGIVIDRKIEPGQTLAAAFQTPELFIVAPNMREEMYVYASVDEADIGLIRDAQARGNVVEFTVDAYPDELFVGTIKEVRFSSTTTQNVVTYPVVISVANPDLKLLPGMTANISFQIEEQKDQIKIPNAALRFYPASQFVREEDRKLLEGAKLAEVQQEEGNSTELSAADKTRDSKNRNKRHVWIVEGELLKAIEIYIGISDSKFTVLESGDLSKGTKLVTGVTSK